MLTLTTVVAIAVGCSVLFTVTAVVGTVVWIRVRQDRLSMAVAHVREGRYARGLQNFPADTVTELSREEGSALRQYGQLPYGRPTEWGLLASRESLGQEETADWEAASFAEKARSLRSSLSLSRSKSKLSKGLLRPRRLSSLATLTETSEHAQSPAARIPSVSKEEVSVSAVEGVMELPAETTPRQTPEREDMESSIRPISGAWPLLNQREQQHASTLFPVLEGQQCYSRVRGGSITAQTAGSMPEQPVPPPPVAYPPNRFRLSKNESSRLSSLSLDTTDSSILEEAMRASLTMDNFVSPNLPPCPTFMPYSANDVGRMDYDRRSMGAPQAPLFGSFAFPANAAPAEAYRLEPDRTSPRRSLTTRSPTHADRVSPPPRRSESLSTSPSKKDTRFTGLGPTPMLHPTSSSSPTRHSMGSNALLPHFSQIHRHSMYDNWQQQRDNDPFYGGPVNNPNFVIRNPESPGRNPASFIIHETPLAADAPPRAPLPSAMKRGSGPRKGHRRQNCVRISIHPPITFGGPAFSPMVEEPEELEELDPRRSELSQVSNLSASHISPLNSSSVSPMSMGRNSYHDPPRGTLRVSDMSLEGRQSSYRRSPSRKRKHARTESVDSVFTATDTSKLPDLFTSLPSAGEGNLSRTPSPEKTNQVWMVSNHTNSPTTYENSPSTGSPRRSGVKGPRSQPGKPPRNSVQRSSLAMPLAETEMTIPYEMTANGLPSRQPSREVRRSTGSLHRTNSSAPSRVPSFVQDKVNALETGDSDIALSSLPTPQPPSSCGVKKQLSTHSTNFVTIWEDQNWERSPTNRYSTSHQVNNDGPVELHGDSSPRRTMERHKSTASSTRTDRRMSRMSSHRMSRAEMTTPVGKTVGLGLGIGCAPTPGSLYDRDGFFKE